MDSSLHIIDANLRKRDPDVNELTLLFQQHVDALKQGHLSYQLHSLRDTYINFVQRVSK